MAKANKDGWIRHRGGACPVTNGTPIDIKFRGLPEERANMHAEHWEWLHRGVSGDIMSYRIHPAEPQEPQPMTAEQIRTKYIENLASIADLHNQNAALVDDLHKLGFDFYDAPKEPQEDMSDPRNWKNGDWVEATESTGHAYVKGSLYQVDYIKGDILMTVRDNRGVKGNGWGVQHFKFHSRPTK